MNDDILVALRKYRPRDGHDPIENFVTAAFAWMLVNHPGMANAVLGHILKGISPILESNEHLHITKPLWNTQKTLPNGVRPDMVCMDQSRDIVIAFEHKVDSGLHQRQISNYRTGLSQEYPEITRRFVVLITRDEYQHAQDPDYSCCWRDVYEWISTWLCKAPCEETGMVASFLRLLKDEGMGPLACISDTAIRLHLAAMHNPLPGPVDELLKRCYKPMCSAGVFGNNPPMSDDVRFGGEWGRHGYQLIGDKSGINWMPGLFVGFLLKPMDHRIVPSQGAMMSPDFCLIVSFGKEYHLRYQTLPSFNDLCGGLESIACKIQDQKQYGSEWNVSRNYLSHDRNPWHPLHLRQPMIEFFRGTTTFDEQSRRFIERASGIYRMVTELPAWDSLRKSLISSGTRSE